MTTEMDWDDIRYLLALLRLGSVRAAARELQVNHTTVTRRLKRMEQRLGSRVVQRTPEGYRATRAGESLLQAGERMEAELDSVLKQVEGADNAVAGRVRLTLTDILLRISRPALAQLVGNHPRLELEITSNPGLSDVMRMDSDIALRIVADPPQDLVGRPIARIPVAVYAGRCSGLTPDNVELEQAPWVRWKAPWNKVGLDTWVGQHYPHSRSAAVVDSDFALENLVAAGAGVGILAPISADQRDDLVRLTPNIPELTLDVWLLVHPDLRGVQRIKVVADALTAWFEAEVGTCE